MAVSTHRLILMFVMLNLIIGIAGTAYYSPRSRNTNVITEYTDLGGEWEDELTSEDAKWGTAKSTSNQFTETTVGNTFTIGKFIWNVFWMGINPFSIRPSMVDTDIEKIIAYILEWFRSLLMIVIALEAYFVFKNRKT